MGVEGEQSQRKAAEASGASDWPPRLRGFVPEMISEMSGVPGELQRHRFEALEEFLFTLGEHRDVYPPPAGAGCDM